MNRSLTFLILLVLVPALWVSVTLAGRVDDVVELEAASTTSDRHGDIGLYAARVADRTPPTAPPTTTTTEAPRSKRVERQTTPPWRSWTWDDLAQCESGGDWSANTGNGYSGGLQMDAVFWESYGGLEFAPEPWMATREQQVVVAERGLAAQGPGAWPTCSYRIGMR